MTGVTPDRLIAAWPEIRAIIGEIPSAEELNALYTAIGAKKSLADIQVPEELLPLLLEYSPCVRNRMTLMRIRRMFL